MKTVERKLNKSQLITIWLLIISVILTGAYITISLIAKRRAQKDNGGDDPSATVDVRYDLGESLSTTNIPLAYAAIPEKNILNIDITRVENDKLEEHFGIIREPDENGNLNGGFRFHYSNDGGDDFNVYYPPIAGEDPDFTYESLYAVENRDGFGQIYYLTYLCSALGNPMFTERIALPTGDDEQSLKKRWALLADCGLTQGNHTSVGVTYCDRDPQTNEIVGEDKSVLVTIGGKALSGVGYYFMVDDRPYIYYTNSEYLSYALADFASYIKGTLVAKGLTNDSMYGPYLTTNFTSWKGTKYTAKEGRPVFLTPDKNKYQNPLVVANGSYTQVNDNYKSKPDAQGYITGSKQLKFDLEALKEHPDFDRISAALVGRDVGVTFGTPITVTLLDDLSRAASSSKLITLPESGSVTYTYTITKIEAVITDGGERTDGTIGATDHLVKVKYTYTDGGTTKTDYHAVLDRRDLSAEESAKLNGKTVGEDMTSSPVVITVEYTESSALKTKYRYVLKGVDAIFDENGNLTDKITENTYVNITYDIYIEDINGSRTESKSHPVRLADLGEGHKLYALKEILLGQGKGEYNAPIYEDTTLYEYMREFTTYEITSIEYFTVNEIVVSFAFQNASERNPYFGENMYVNKLTNEYKIYGLNAGSCEEVVKLLGGIGTDSNSAAGLSGTTVAIGLTAANMSHYGLYAHKIYFEMPRLIYDASEGTSQDDEDMLSDFAWIDTIGFTLYISDVAYDEDGNKVRYIGSDMYDIVVKVYTDDFDFVEYDFVEFWARRSMVMMNITKLDELKLELFMSDLSGSYTFDVDFTNGYSGYINGELIFSEEKRDGLSAVKEFQTVDITASHDAFKTKFKELYGEEKADLAWLYKQTLGGGKTNYYPGVQNTTYGAAYFNSAYSILQLISYVDTLTEDEQTEYFGKNLVMSMHIKVEGQKIGDEEFYYTYDFYRIDDRRIMVALYKSNANGDCIDDSGNVVPSDKIGENTVSDFYIDAFSFKKLVNAYIQLLNGADFDENLGYPATR